MGRFRLPPVLVVTLLGVVVAIVALGLVAASGRDVVVFPADQILVDGSARTYRLVVPDGGTGTPLPLVFHFHGHGNTAESEADRTRLDHLAAARGFVLVYPEAVKGNWAIGQIDPSPPDENPDIRFFDALLEHLVARLNIDPARVYVTGMSMGGTFVHDLALARSGKIAAAVSHSGSAPSEIGSERPFPIMILVGAAESEAALESALAEARQYRLAGHPCDLLVVNGIGHEWAEHRIGQMWQFLDGHRLDHSTDQAR